MQAAMPRSARCSADTSPVCGPFFSGLTSWAPTLNGVGARNAAIWPHKVNGGQIR